MNIQQRRLNKGWSQEELARHSGLSTRTIQRIENGHNAGGESLKSLAAVFETSVSQLITEQETIQQTDEISDSEENQQSSLTQLEQDAIKDLKGIFAGPKRGEPDQLMAVERKLVNEAKGIINKFKKL